MESYDDIYANAETIQSCRSRTTADQNPKSSPGDQHSEHTDDRFRVCTMEMCDDIYANAETIQSCRSRTTADQNPKSSPGDQHSGRRFYRWTAVCLGLLCVLLLTAITLLCIHYNGVVNKTMEKQNQLSETLSLLTANYTAERHQLETSNTILKAERDQLETNYNIFKAERDQLESNNTILKSQRDQLETSNTILKAERDQLETNYNIFKAERDQLESNNTILKSQRDQLETSNTILKAERDQLSIEKDRIQKMISDLDGDIKMVDYKALLRGIGEFPFPHHAQPCQLQLSGENAIPLAVSPSGHVLLAASRYGRGKVVVAAHEDYIQGAIGIPAFGQFVKNAIEWLKPHTHAAVGVSGMSHLPDHLTKSGFKVKTLSSYDGTVGVFCHVAYSDRQVEEVLDFMRGGGGLLIGGQAWYWASQHRGANVLELFPGNKLTRPAGISFTSKHAEKGTLIKVPQEIPAL